MPKKITVYTIEHCPYCVSAKLLLEQNNIPYQEVYLDKKDQDKLTALISKSGMRTFPQIFCDEQIIGGYDQLKQLYDSGKFQTTFQD